MRISLSALSLSPKEAARRHTLGREGRRVYWEGSICVPLWWPSQQSLPILTSRTAEESRAAVAQCGLNVHLQSSGVPRSVLESKWPVLLKHIKATIDKDRPGTRKAEA